MVSADTSETSSSRTYVSELRQQQATATRERVVGAAAELFAEKGYAGTTMPAIARRAGVSTETVQNHGPKVELLRAAIAAVTFGAGPGAAVVDTELGAQLLNASSPQEAARVSAEVLAAVNERAYGVWLAFSEAARSDPVLEAELRRLTGEVATQNEAVLEQWGRRGWLRTDLPISSLVLRAVAIGSVELWDRVVRLDGHGREEYQELVAGLLLDALTPPAVRAR
jgi:AcrR family transcriptional regulator